MEKINQHNYEAYFLDFTEGNLDNQQFADLEAFLISNPHLRAELEDFQLVSLPNATDNNRDWSGLKKLDISDLQSNRKLRTTFFIEAIEGNLTDYEKEILKKLISDKKIRKEYEGFEKTLLKPQLRKTITHDELYQFGLNLPIAEFNYETHLTARTEDLLNAAQNEALKAFAKKKENGSRDLKIADNLRLKPEINIYYPDKAKLHKEKSGKIIPLWLYRAAAVAAIFLLGIFLWNQRKFTSIADKPIAQNLNTKPITRVEIDPIKTERIALPDSLSIEYLQGVEPPAQLIQPRGAHLAQLAEEEPPEAVREHANPKKMDALGKEIQISIPPIEHKIAMLPQIDIEKSITSEQPKEESTPPPSYASEYKTLPQIAKNALANKLNIDKAMQDEIADIMAQRLTASVGKVLDTEFKMKTIAHPESDVKSYMLRIGSFELSHTMVP